MLSYRFLFFYICLHQLVVANGEQRKTKYFEPKEHQLLKRGTGGQEALAHSWPWMVLVQSVQTTFLSATRYLESTNICGGTLLRVNSKNESDIVLTAAHCFEPGYEMKVTLGDHDREDHDQGEQIIHVKRRVWLEAYDKNPKDVGVDLMLLKLNRPVKFSNTIYPISLVSSEPDKYSTCFVAGWGKLEDYGESPILLHEIQVPVHENSYCTRPYIWGRRLNTAKVICAGRLDGGGNICNGDSGGPLMCETNSGSWMQYGIVASGDKNGCSTRNKPGLFVRVSYYYDWIMEQINFLSDVKE